MATEPLDVVMWWAAVQGLTVAVMGGAIYVLTRAVRRPAVANLLWMALLAKLFFPPLVALEIGLWPAAPASTPIEETPAMAEPSAVDGAHLVEETAAPTSKTPDVPPPAVASSAPEPSAGPVESTSNAPLQLRGPFELRAPLEPAAGDLGPPGDASPQPATIAEEFSHAIGPETAFAADQIAERPTAAQAEQTASHSPKPVVVAADPPMAAGDVATAKATGSWRFEWRWAFLSVWMVGSIWVAGRLLSQAWRLHRAVRLATPPPEELATVLREVCGTAGVKRVPRAASAGGAISPMVVSWWGRAVVIVPQDLFDQMAPEQRRLVLAHELAHIRRRDHLVRYLEAAACVAYWWHPVVWLARAELRVAEEECCDQLVLSWFPEAARTYGAALLDTVDFLAAAGPVVPVASSGFVSERIFKQRLEAIMDPSKRRVTPRAVKLLVLAIAAIALPISARAVQQEAPSADVAAIEVGQRVIQDSSDDASQEVGVAVQDNRPSEGEVVMQEERGSPTSDQGGADQDLAQRIERLERLVERLVTAQERSQAGASAAGGAPTDTGLGPPWDVVREITEVDANGVAHTRTVIEAVDGMGVGVAQELQRLRLEIAKRREEMAKQYEEINQLQERYNRLLHVLGSSPGTPPGASLPQPTIIDPSGVVGAAPPRPAGVAPAAPTFVYPPSPAIEPTALVIQLNLKGKFLIDGKEVSRPDMRVVLREAKEKSHNALRVVVRTERETPAQYIVEILNYLDAAQIKNYKVYNVK